MRQLLHAVRDDWRDHTTVGLCLLAAGLCLAAAVFRLLHDDKTGTAIFSILTLVISFFGVRLASRKLNERG